jgi:hypothetical protein
VSCGPVTIGHNRMLMRTTRPERMAFDKRKKVRRSKPDSAHVDQMLDEALRETFPASDPIAITIDKPLKAIVSEVLRGPDNLATSPRTTVSETKPEPALVTFMMQSHSSNLRSVVAPGRGPRWQIASGNARQSSEQSVPPEILEPVRLSRRCRTSDRWPSEPSRHATL